MEFKVITVLTSSLTTSSLKFVIPSIENLKLRLVIVDSF